MKYFMAFLWWIDSRVINWVFQPITNFIAPVISCYALAAFLLTGSIPIQFANWLYSGQWVTALICMPWLPQTLVRAYRLEMRPTIVHMIHERVAYCPLRVGLFLPTLMIFPLDILLIRCGGPSVIIGIYTWWAMLCALYLMACQQIPPRRRVVERLA